MLGLIGRNRAIIAASLLHLIDHELVHTGYMLQLQAVVRQKAQIEVFESIEFVVLDG